MTLTSVLTTLVTLLFVYIPINARTPAATPASTGHVGAEAQPQALNPPYLSEMPSVDRVLSAMKTPDPPETAQRQIGAFYQLIEIIKTLSGPREFRGFTPDESRIIGAYQVAQYNVAQAADKQFPSPNGGSTKFSDVTPYRYGRWDRRFGVEGIPTFKLFFSAALKAEFDKIVAGDNARREARAQSYRNQGSQPNQTTPSQPTSGVAPGSRQELARCIASGRSQRVCFSEVMGNGFDQLTAGITDQSPRGLDACL